MFTTSPENAAAITRLEAALSELPIGGIINYKQLVTVAKFDIRNGSRWLLAKAIDNVEKTSQCAFECVRSVGVRRLPTDEIPDIGLASLSRIRRAAKRGKKRIDRANTNSMSESDKRRVIGYGAMLGAVSVIADGRRATSIAAVADPVKPIPPENILDIFRQKT